MCKTVTSQPGGRDREHAVLQVVILSQVLACDATLGYEDLFNTQVLKFNGTPVRNLKHLAQLTSACSDPFMRFDLEYNVRRLTSFSLLCCSPQKPFLAADHCALWDVGRTVYNGLFCS